MTIGSTLAAASSATKPGRHCSLLLAETRSVVWVQLVRNRMLPSLPTGGRSLLRRHVAEATRVLQALLRSLDLVKDQNLCHFSQLSCQKASFLRELESFLMLLKLG